MRSTYVLWKRTKQHTGGQLDQIILRSCLYHRLPGLQPHFPQGGRGIRPRVSRTRGRKRSEGRKERRQPTVAVSPTCLIPWQWAGILALPHHGHLQCKRRHSGVLRITPFWPSQAGMLPITPLSTVAPACLSPDASFPSEFKHVDMFPLCVIYTHILRGRENLY